MTDIHESAVDDRTRAIVIHLFRKSGQSGGRAVAACLEEAVGLAAAIELNVVSSEAVSLPKINAGTYFGKGTVERLGELVQEE